MIDDDDDERVRPRAYVHQLSAHNERVVAKRLTRRMLDEPSVDYGIEAVGPVGLTPFKSEQPHRRLTNFGTNRCRVDDSGPRSGEGRGRPGGRSR